MRAAAHSGTASNGTKGNEPEPRSGSSSCFNRKQEIDDLNAAGTFVSNPKWLLDAIEGLLRSELDLREQLRNAGLLR